MTEKFNIKFIMCLLLPLVHENQTGPGATPRSQTKSESMKGEEGPASGWGLHAEQTTRQNEYIPSILIWNGG